MEPSPIKATKPKATKTEITKAKGAAGKKKKKGEVLLPGQTFIYQPNRVTNGRFEQFTLTQYKLLASLIYQFQKAIQLDMEGRDWRQLEMFSNEENKDLIRVGIPLHTIGKPNQYKEIVEQATGLMNAKTYLKSQLGADYISVASLVTKIDIPVKENGMSVLYLHMYKDVAKLLIEIDKKQLDNGKAQPVNFTRYLYEVALSATNKYTLKLYMLLCSWRQKGEFFIPLEQLYKDLGLEEGEYKKFFDFKRRILLPVQADLEGVADCWFDCNERGFEVKKGRSVIGLNFKVITQKRLQDKSEQADHCRYILRDHMKFSQKQLEELEPIFREQFFMQEIQVKILELIDHVRKNTQTITNPQAYIIKSLLNAFASKG